MITIKINGENQEINPQTNLVQLTNSLSSSTPYFAVSLNRSVIPKSEYAQVYLNEGDEIEIVHPVAGG